MCLIIFAGMASSLEAALACDAKLRRLFDRIDVDLGGTIDQQELHNALKAAGKAISTEAVAEMFRAADYDGGTALESLIDCSQASETALLRRSPRRMRDNPD